MHIRTKRVVEKLRAGGGLNAHRLVAEIAIEMANEYFEVYALENEWYRKMRADGRVTEKEARRVFVERTAPRLFEDARQALADCLAQPDDVCPVSLKDQIAEALILDNDLRGNRIVAEDRVTVPTNQTRH
jgi:hypothetical protein